jgi:type II secretory pathway pseudopilin PulG
MAMPMRSAKQPGSGEEGYVLLGVLFLVVVMLIWLAVAAPKVATEIRRDKELELYHRGMQYTRAIRMYYKKFQRYPTSLDQLENSNNIRFLRKRYNDPFTGKPDWRLIHVGEAKVQQTGLFGQPAGVAGAGGTGVSGAGNSGFGGQSASGFNSSGQGFSNSGGSSFGGSSGSSFGNSFGSSGGSSFGGSSGSSFGGSSGGSSFGGSSGSSFGNGGQTGSAPPPADPSSGNGTTGSSNGTSGSGFGNTGSSTGGPTGLGTSSLNSSSGSPIGSTGPIVGVASIVTRESIREFKKQKHYNEWEFVYNPQADLGGLGGNTGAGVLPQNGVNPSNSFGSSFGNSGTGAGGNSGFGNSFGNSGSNNNGNGSNNNGSNGNPPGNPPGTPVNGNPPTDPNNPNQPPPNQVNPAPQ